VLDVPALADQASRGGRAAQLEAVAGCWPPVTPCGRPRMHERFWSSRCGEGAGIEFLSWLANMDLPDPESVLADPDGFDLPSAAIEPSHPHRRRRGGHRPRRRGVMVSAWQWWRASLTRPDVAALAARTLAGARPEGAELRAALEDGPVLRAAALSAWRRR